MDFTRGERADKDVLNQYIEHLNQHFPPRFAKCKLASIRIFYHEMQICVKLEKSFYKLHIHSLQQFPQVIPEQGVQALSHSTYNTYTLACHEGLLDIVVLDLLLNAGLRVSELA